MGKYNEEIKKYNLMTNEEIEFTSKMRYTFYDNDGYLYFVKLDRLRNNYKNGNNPQKFGKANKYNLENINTWLLLNTSNIKAIGYVGSKIECRCPIHGKFLSTWSKISVLKGYGCVKCGFDILSNNRKKDFSEVVTDFKKIHGNKYLYDMAYDIYENSSKKIPIICIDHGVFYQTPNNHNRGSGCPICGTKLSSMSLLLEKENVIFDMQEKHNYKYKYEDFEYKGNKTEIKITCPIHGEFYQKIGKHKYGSGCPTCSGNEIRTISEFISIANKKHSFKYLYEKAIYINAHTNIIITCPTHGDFLQSPNNHIRGQNCPICKAKSKGEDKIREFFQSINIKFVEQKRYKDCIDKRKLPFDFYIPNKNICIEYDGIQHFTTESWGGKKGFIDRNKKDSIKTKYCNDNNIKLIRIPYWDFDNIESILIKELNL